jgi:Pathogenicity locus
MSETLLIKVPGIGKTLVKDFARIGLYFVEDFESKVAQEVFENLLQANLLENHKTSKNYLYVIRMLVYYSGGGREEEKIKWNFWKD